jgi:superfamily II DNA/RNA helicase
LKEKTMQNFNELNLPQTLLQALEKMQFMTPTPIQAQAIPVALEGNDILGSAQTGTGKTGAFGIPLVAHLINNPGSIALIMTPTRELAVQVNQMLKKLLSNNTYIKTAQLIGGEVMFRQFAQLEEKPRIIIGTPGRINDHLARKSLKLDKVDFLVLDETDRMLDMGFGVQIDKILTYMPGKRQTLLFSATLPSHIVRLADKYMNDAVRISVGSTTAPIANIKQEIIKVAQPQKYDVLTQQLDQRGGSIIVFVRTKHGCDRLAAKLERENHSAAAIHGDLRQNKRDKVIRNFRDKRTRILIATDVAARGLDIPHIEHVINYDLPQCPEDYIHRIGRTARAGAEGAALCLISPDEGGKWAAIERLMGGKGSDEPQQRSGRGGERSKRQSGYGRKNEDSFKRESGGFRQERSRKPHRKGQSWQRAHDDAKIAAAQNGEAAPKFRPERAPQAEAQRFERKFKKRDDKKSFRDRDAKPWQGNKGGFDKPKRDRAKGGDRPYIKRERSEGGDKPWQKKREGGFDKPKREGGFEKKPWQKRESGNDRPFQKRDHAEGGDRPYVKRGRSEGGDKPWQKKREGGSDRPFQKRERNNEGRADRPYQQKRDGKFGGKPSFQKRDGAKPGSKPQGKPSWSGKNRDADRPMRRNRDAG